MRRNRELREERILQHFKDMIEEKGFFDIKVSELAKRARISVGTLYSHFPCKEDLLLALSFQSKSSRAEFVRSAVGQATTPNERFIVGIISLWRSYQAQRSLAELEFLAMTPSIWRRASPRFQVANSNLRQELFGFSKKLLRVAFKEAPSSLTRSYLDVGHRALLLGMDVMLFSEFETIKKLFKSEKWEKCMITNFSCLLVGWGWPKQEVDAMIESGLEIVNQMPEIPIKFRRAI